MMTFSSRRGRGRARRRKPRRWALHCSLSRYTSRNNSEATKNKSLFDFSSSVEFFVFLCLPPLFQLILLLLVLHFSGLSFPSLFLLFSFSFPSIQSATAGDSSHFFFLASFSPYLPYFPFFSPISLPFPLFPSLYSFPPHFPLFPSFLCSLRWPMPLVALADTVSRGQLVRSMSGASQ